MITACVVSIPSVEDMVEIMIRSLIDKSSLITKVLVFQHNNETTHSTQRDHIKTYKNIKIEYFTGNNHPYNHALGLHECIDRVKTDYLLLTDPDIVYQLDNFDKFYLDLYEKHNLNIIGIGHTAPRAQAFQYFPTVTSCLIKKDTLPDVSFLKGQIKRRGYISTTQNLGHDNFEELDGKYLMQSPIPDLVDKFPNPQGLFDAGCNLWLWN